MARAKLSWALILTCGFAHAASSPNIAASRGEILQLGARLNALEKNLGQHNDKYLATLERIRLIETDVATYQQKLTAVRAEAVKREQEMASILRAHTLAMVEDEVVPDEAYQKLAQENRNKAHSAVKEAEALEKIVVEIGRAHV